jgi:hypothetical protein
MRVSVDPVRGRINSGAKHNGTTLCDIESNKNNSYSMVFTYP